MNNTIFNILSKYLPQPKLFKILFNYSPTYRRSVGRVKEVSEDLHKVRIELPLNYKNRNFVGSMFGGSLFAATDPIYMVQLIQILGPEYVVWDKAATIKYKRPAKEKVYATFQFSNEEIEEIKQRIKSDREIDIVKRTNLVNYKGNVFAELEKTIYVASKAHYKMKKMLRNNFKRAS